MALGKKTGGRQPNSPNKMTSKAKDALMEVFRGIGDVEDMIVWAKANRGEFYKLWARLVPTEVHGKGFTPPPEKLTKAETDAQFAKRVAYVLNAGVYDLAEAELLNQMNTERPN